MPKKMHTIFILVWCTTVRCTCSVYTVHSRCITYSPFHIFHSIFRYLRVTCTGSCEWKKKVQPLITVLFLTNRVYLGYMWHDPEISLQSRDQIVPLEMGFEWPRTRLRVPSVRTTMTQRERRRRAKGVKVGKRVMIVSVCIGCVA